MIKKTLSFLLLLLAAIVFATWQYRLLCVLLFVLLNKGWIKSRPLMSRYEHSYKILVLSLLICILIAIPKLLPAWTNPACLYGRSWPS